jgi:glycosyltransferase involved in cell wall biosynthesis
MPKVSVIIPTHNRANFLRSAIESVLRQTFQDFEIIVVDDASQDRTPEVIKGFPDQRIRYVGHDSHKGQGASRNAGIKNAVAEYVAFLDDDDEWLPEKLEKQVFLLERSPAKTGMVYTGFCKVDASTHGVISRVIPRKRGSILGDLCLGNCIGTCSTVLMRRECFAKTGVFDEMLASGADYDMWLRVAKEFDIEFVAEPLVLYTIHSNRISTNYEALIRGIEGQLAKYAPFFALNSKSYSLRYLSLGVFYCYRGNLTKGRAAFYKGIKLNPFEVRHYFNLFLSLFGPDHFRKFKEFKENHFSFLR